MLIIPMTGKLSWRDPPFITILLILVNCFAYFVLQSGDAEQYRKAGEFYMKSGLAEIEIDKFTEYMKTANRSEEISVPAKRKKGDPAVLAYLYSKMTSNDEFMRKLNNDEIIKPGDPVFTKWKDLQKKYRAMRSTIVGERYGYKPVESNFHSSFTYMFLHGSGMHLLGNMIFLWLVGASGAISGIIGAYTVLFGMKKVKIFYSLGFFFSYAKDSDIRSALNRCSITGFGRFLSRLRHVEATTLQFHIVFEAGE
jgi:membrane associated rhomboid family serine protease